jgi:hypothetical protein
VSNAKKGLTERIELKLGRNNDVKMCANLISCSDKLSFYQGEFSNLVYRGEIVMFIVKNRLAQYICVARLKMKHYHSRAFIIAQHKPIRVF